LVSGGLIKDWFKIPYESSILPAYFISLLVGFILTKLFAFDARRSQQTNREMIKFLLVASFSGFVTWFFSILPYRFLQTITTDYFSKSPTPTKSKHNPDQHNPDRDGI